MSPESHFKKAILLSYLSPLGTAREERSHGLSGGVGGVLGMGKRQLNVKQDSNHATNFEPYGSRRQNFF